MQWTRFGPTLSLPFGPAGRPPVRLTRAHAPPCHAAKVHTHTHAP